MNTIVINGSRIVTSGSNIVVSGNSIMINGQVIQDGLSGIVEVKFEGDLANLNSSASVNINGNVHGDVDCGGSLKCGDIGGSADVGGSVNCGKVGGDVDAGGSIKMSR